MESLTGQSRPADFVIGVDSGSSDNSREVLHRHLVGTANTVAALHKTGFGTAVRRGIEAGESAAGTRSADGPDGTASLASTDSLNKRGARNEQPASMTAGMGAGASGHPDGHTLEDPDQQTPGTSSPVALAGPDDDPSAEFPPEQEWLWLLHDDSAPHPEALAELLTAVERAPSVTIAGCKQLEWDEPRALIDVGLSISGWAERLTLIDVDELDQGQYDGRSDMFAVNSAGMLIRRDVFDALAGFDPALPEVGDDVDLCWRNRLAGHRVVVVPAAKMYHAVHRPHPAGTPAAARRSEVYLRLKHAPWPKLPFLAVGALVGSIIRFLLSVVAKDPAYGATQLVATVRGLSRPFALMKARWRAFRSRKVSRKMVRPLQTPRADARAHRRSRLEAFEANEVVGDGSGGEDLSAQQPTGGSQDFVPLAAPGRSWSGTGAVAAALILTAVSFVGLHRLFGSEALAGGALLPLSPSLAGIWNNASSWWVGLGAGFSGHGDPFDYVLWVLGLLGFGDGSTAVLWLTLLALPLAGLSAWVGVGAFTQHRLVRFWAALLWASVPAFQVALGSGRLGALLAHLLIPLVVLGMVRAVGAAMPRRPNPAPGFSSNPAPVAKPGTGGLPSWTAAAAAGLALAALTASAPSLLPVAIAVVVGVSIALRRRAKTLWWSLLPSLVLFAPFAVSVLQTPRALLADPGRALFFTSAPMWQQFLGYPVALQLDSTLRAWPGLSDLAAAPWTLIAAGLIGAPLLVLAAVALFAPAARSTRANLVRVLWAAGLLAAGASMVYTQFAVSSGGDFLVPVFNGPLVSVLIFMLLAAAVTGSNTLLRIRRPTNGTDGTVRRAPRVLAGLTAVILLLGPATSLALWVVPNAGVGAGSPAAAQSGDAQSGDGVADTVHGGRTLIHGVPQRTLPATATDRANSPLQTRTLVLNVDGDGAVSSALVRGGGTTLDSLSAVAATRGVAGEPGAETLTGPDGAEQMLRTTVAIITAGSGVDPREQLHRLGAGFVVLAESNTAAELLADRIDAVPGLAAVGKTDSGWLWRVRPPAAANDEEQAAEATGAVRVVDAEGRTLAPVASNGTAASTEIPAGGGDRMVVLAERAGPYWSAWLDGEKLTSTSQGWAQAFKLPADGGSLEIRYDHPWAGWWAAAAIVVIGLTILLAIPLPAKRRNTIRRSVGSSGGPAGTGRLI